MVNGLGAIIDEAERGFLSIDDLRELHSDMEDLTCVIVTTPARNKVVNELIHLAKAIAEGAEDPTILDNIEKIGLEIISIDEGGTYVDSTDGQVFVKLSWDEMSEMANFEVNGICTTSGCFEPVMPTPFTDKDGNNIPHPSGLCMDCYQSHKQDLRDGKELIE